MRDRRCLLAVSTALLGLLVAAPASAQAPGCCASGPVVVYGAAPVPPIVPPTGYVLDPSDARPPIYVVNRGPYYSGPGIYAVPTYSEGGYAYRGGYYPYVTTGAVGYWGPPPYPYAPPPYVRPRVRVYGDAIAPDARPAAVPPYGAYAVRAAPDARVIQVSQHD